MSDDIIDVPEETNKVSKSILDAAFYVHTQLGPGLLESVYEQCLAHVLVQSGVYVERQKALPVIFDGITMEDGFRLDLLV